ncbi:amidohydrolase family protein [Adlercreutzia sp. ZJ141]|uniref:amidohydrolase family protein n=1 Tax=Adlercreutzia sp. ZJ141 TaxID=2709406 RepID=UPI0013EB5DFF|nr:amidohydrolase family protein [Adlercreutzia sp. ZJ141]
MPVIDAHAHIYPARIAARAVDSVSRFYSLPMFADGPDRGTADHLLRATNESPITHFIVHSVATTAHAVESINTFIAEQCRLHSQFIGFATMHPDYADPEREINRAISLGLHGIKLHPDSQTVNMDDPRLMNVYEIMQANGMRLVMHTGDFRFDYSNPERLTRILKAFPNLVVDAAHFGNWSKFDVGFDILHRFENVFVDASSSSFWLGKRHACELIRLWGTDRVMLGSDYPMWSPVAEYDFLDSLPFTDDEKDQLFWHNAEQFLGFSVA